MMVLSRQTGQSIVVGKTPEQWTVTVLEISGDKVRLGITSPDGRASFPVRVANAIALSPEIAVTIVDIRGDKVRVGVKAPKTYAVHRLEIVEAIRRERGEGGE
ncbi:MAG TPA: carbon storage regulator [Tepidisphaeraceae bacterium]|jgi:carbon storage regulator|nr:carbon storage regulator [Tepidisphaeraceae bacterium]